MMAGPLEQDSSMMAENGEAKPQVVEASIRPAYRLLIIAGLALMVVLGYVIIAGVADKAGYPLDDSWIHQTYARNLARSGRWEFVPGIASVGSTAPLWTILLSLGYLIRLPHIFLTTLLGWLCLTWTGWGAMRLWTAMWPNRRKQDWIIGIVLVLSWPLIWAAASGMETLLFIALSFEIFCQYSQYRSEKKRRTLVLGILAGLLVLVRPEGLGVLILILVGLVLQAGDWRLKFRDMGLVIAGAALPLAPYFSVNVLISGTIWPNTFYAKQVEYASVFAQSIFVRFIKLLYFSFGGPSEGWRGISAAHLVLLPGSILAAVNALKYDWSHKRVFRTMPLLWATGLVFVYAWRLPVTYQHGRYLFPAVPIWIMYGLAGWLEIFSLLKTRFGAESRTYFVLSRIGFLTLGVLLLIFIFLGLQVFVQDVSFVNGEMVAVGHWIEENTPQDSLIAAHDIGAIGYFGERAILDLAGLITPEVIPYLSDEQAVNDYLLQGDADYLVTAPGWMYEPFTQGENTMFVYSTDYAWTREQGVNNMEVYSITR